MRAAHLTLLLVAGCAAGPEPIPGSPASRPDSLELFRRSRFEDLAREDPEALVNLARLFRSSNISMTEDFEDLTARASYRRGEVDAATEAIGQLSEDNKTRRIIGALLSHVDRKVALRESRSARRIVELPLVAKALDRGYVVIAADIEGRTFRVLWDTGATDDVLSPQAADALELPLTEVQFTLRRQNDALVVRLAASVTKEMRVGAWTVRNVPWLVTDLDTVEGLKRDIEEVDGFLSPQLLLPNGCFAVDRLRSLLRLGFGQEACAQLMSEAHFRRRLFTWDGEVFVSGRIHNSPELALRLETGSPITFLRMHAARYLPQGLLAVSTGAATGEEIARQLPHQVTISVAGREKLVSAIDLDPARLGAAHDDLATVGNDVLLQGRGLAIDFTRMELGVLDHATAAEPGSRPR